MVKGTSSRRNSGDLSELSVGDGSVVWSVCECAAIVVVVSWRGEIRVTVEGCGGVVMGAHVSSVGPVLVSWLCVVGVGVVQGGEGVGTYRSEVRGPV